MQGSPGIQGCPWDAGCPGMQGSRRLQVAYRGWGICDVISVWDSMGRRREDHKPGSLEQQEQLPPSSEGQSACRPPSLGGSGGAVHSGPSQPLAAGPATLAAPGLTAAWLLSQPAVNTAFPSSCPWGHGPPVIAWGHPKLGGSHLQILTELHLHRPPESREILLRKVPVDLPLGGSNPTRHKHRGPLAQLRTSEGPLPRCYLQSLRPRVRISWWGREGLLQREQRGQRPGGWTGALGPRPGRGRSLLSADGQLRRLPWQRT